jgi:hypothetical protein
MTPSRRGARTRLRWRTPCAFPDDPFPAPDCSNSPGFFHRRLGRCDRRSTRPRRSLDCHDLLPAATVGGMNICVPTKSLGQENRARALSRRAPWRRRSQLVARDEIGAGADGGAGSADPVVAGPVAPLEPSKLPDLIAGLAQQPRPSPAGAEQPADRGDAQPRRRVTRGRRPPTEPLRAASLRRDREHRHRSSRRRGATGRPRRDPAPHRQKRLPTSFRSA